MSLEQIAKEIEEREDYLYKVYEGYKPYLDYQKDKGDRND